MLSPCNGGCRMGIGAFGWIVLAVVFALVVVAATLKQ
jgi:hypothetical protein